MTESSNPIRICEWSSTCVDLSKKQRTDLFGAAKNWQRENNLPEPPLWFDGPEGKTLKTRQYVGVIEFSDVTIEIFPKLDKHLLEQPIVDDNTNVNSVMSNLLWMLGISGHFGVCEIGDAALKESPTSFYDVFALLMGKHLLAELNLGIPHTYVTVNDDTRMVRGKICLTDQVTRNMNRFDMVSCEWDEFTPDIPINQLLKCSCRFLQQRVQSSGAFSVLADCITQLQEICDIDPFTALTNVMGHRWDRRTERFRLVFDLAERLLRGYGHMLSYGNTSTFVFLLDMNKVFEDYVKSVLEITFNVSIQKQKVVGQLFPQLEKGRVNQQADYFWCTGNTISWIGDAKYKHLTKDQNNPLGFTQLPAEDSNDSSTIAGKVISPNDIRQLTVYAELVRKNNAKADAPNILLCYPYVGDGEIKSDSQKAWNGSKFTLCPVLMKYRPELRDLLPADIIRL